MATQLDASHKKHLLGALDHIDGLLGEYMHKARTHVADAKGAVEDHENKEMDEKKYEGKDQPGGHAGHPFGKKSQKGEDNSHFGHKKDEEGDEPEPELPNIARRRGTEKDGGASALLELLSK